MAYPKQYVACRANACHWEDYEPSPGQYRKPEFGSRWVQYCPNCTSFRQRLCNRITGEALTPWSHDRPVGFRATKPMTKQDFRRLYFRQQGERPVRKKKVARQYQRRLRIVS